MPQVFTNDYAQKMDILLRKLGSNISAFPSPNRTRRTGAQPSSRAPSPDYTLHWAYLLPHVRCFRIHCCRGSGGDSPCRGPSEPEKPTLLGLAFVNRYRIVNLAVAPAEPGRDGRVEFLVEPIPKEGFLVPRAEWGRAAMLYSTPRT